MSVLETLDIQRDSFSNALTIVHKDHGAEPGYHIEYRGTVDPVVEANKHRVARMDITKHREGYTHVASIHPVMWQMLKNQGIADDPRALRRWLDDSENSCWRTHPSRLSK